MNAPTCSLQFNSNHSTFIFTQPILSSTILNSKSRIGCYVLKSIDTWTGLSNDHSSCSKIKDNWFGSGDREEEDKWRKRKVECQVEVISWRERRIRAQTCVNADVHAVWRALTDYERLADFIPNLVSSGLIPCPHPGRIWLEQRGLQRALYWHIEARVVLDLQEFPNSATDRELHFSMVDGDFKKFEGKWCVKSVRRSSTTTLSYEVNVIPKYNFPAILVERIISSDLPVNLQALAWRAENFENQQAQITENIVGILAPPKPISLDTNGATTEEKKESPEEVKEIYPSSNFGPLPPSSIELNSNWGVFGKFCKLERPVVDEVHLRRFDELLENGGVHRCVVASITVKAPVRDVWNVLTAYESLPEIVPNLAISKILSRENNKVRILQEGCKGLLYMVLHARVVLDLCEKLEHEISFEQVEGDFDSFKGKWLLEQLGNQHTLLKYSVESKMHKNAFLSEAIIEEVIYEDLPSNLCAIRDYTENRLAGNSFESCDHLIHTEENISSPDNNRCDDKLDEKSSDNDRPHSSRQRPRVPGLQGDVEVLKSELLTFISAHGQDGFMPMRKQLRKYGRVDIEKAITRMGGFRRIASLMNLSLAYKQRKPKGYWDNLENLEEEISRFQKSWGMDLSFMPSRKSFERAGIESIDYFHLTIIVVFHRKGRYDIARALEKWGGLHEVSRLLSLKVRHPNRQARVGKDKKIDNIACSTINGDQKASSKLHVSQDTEKWLMKVKDLDINWVE